jgi:hypothetical protein
VKAEDIIRALAAEDIEEREFGKFGGPPTVCRRCCHILPGPHATICLWAAAKQWVEAADREPKLLFCGVRDGGDFWHLECRFDDGQKFAAVQVDKTHEKLADEIAAYLNGSHDGVLRGEDARKLLSSLDDVASPEEIAVRRAISRSRLGQIEGKTVRLAACEKALGLAEIRVRQLGEQLASCEKALAERDARVLVLTRFALNVRDGWDCDEDAHRHRTPCRCCEAEKLVGPAS